MPADRYPLLVERKQERRLPEDEPPVELPDELNAQRGQGTATRQGPNAPEPSEFIPTNHAAREVPPALNAAVFAEPARAVFTRGSSGQALLGFTEAVSDRRAEEFIARQVALGSGQSSIVSRDGLETMKTTGPRREGVGRVASSRVAEGAEFERTSRDDGIIAPSVRPCRLRTA